MQPLSAGAGTSLDGLIIRGQRIARMIQAGKGASAARVWSGTRCPRCWSRSGRDLARLASSISPAGRAHGGGPGLVTTADRGDRTEVPGRMDWVGASTAADGVGVVQAREISPRSALTGPRDIRPAVSRNLRLAGLATASASRPDGGHLVAGGGPSRREVPPTWSRLAGTTFWPRRPARGQARRQMAGKSVVAIRSGGGFARASQQGSHM